MKKGIVLLGLCGLIVVGGLHAKRKFHGSNHRLDKVKTEVKISANKSEIKNGDLIFQTSLSGQSNPTCNKIKIFALRHHLHRQWTTLRF